MADGVVYIGSGDHNVYALNASTGAKLWGYATGSYVISSPAVADGVVYVGSQGGDMYALGASNGTELSANVTGYLPSSPAVANGYVSLSNVGLVLALNANTGTELWSYNADSLPNALLNRLPTIQFAFVCPSASGCTLRMCRCFEPIEPPFTPN